MLSAVPSRARCSFRRAVDEAQPYVQFRLSTPGDGFANFAYQLSLRIAPELIVDYTLQ